MTDKIEPVFLRRNFNDSEVVELEKKKKKNYIST
tara:strand:- start:6782 stop:6883 length:102 start_codon:yes stop_codon:yes gene_type:complete